jgi:hypothetical protein
MRGGELRAGAVKIIKKFAGAVKVLTQISLGISAQLRFFHPHRSNRRKLSAVEERLERDM